MKVKALSLRVYKNPLYKGCTNGGYTEEHDEIFVVCEKGPHSVDTENPALFVLKAGGYGSLCLVPYKKPEGMCGPMMGGNYASTSDGRFSRMCEALTGNYFYGAVAVHDRFETWAQYEALSR